MKIGLKCYVELDTDPDGDNKPSPFSPGSLAVILPHISEWIRKTSPPESGAGPRYGAGTSAADILREMASKEKGGQPTE